MDSAARMPRLRRRGRECRHPFSLCGMKTRFSRDGIVSDIGIRAYTVLILSHCETLSRLLDTCPIFTYTRVQSRDVLHFADAIE